MPDSPHDPVLSLPDEAEAVSEADADGRHLDEAVAKLAALSEGRYEQYRRGEAKRLNVRAAVLDRLVENARHVTGDSRAGRPLSLQEHEPWPVPVDGAALLAEVSTTVCRYVALPSHRHADAIALWVVHTFVYDASPITPRLAITSAEKRCGKSRLLTLLSMLTPRSLKADNVTPSIMFRVIELARPTLLIDEFDSFGADNNELRGIVNSGHDSKGTVPRNVASGNDYEPRLFATFAPVAIAAIGRLPGTIEDRSILIPMRRKTVNERTERTPLRPAGIAQAAGAALRALGGRFPQFFRSSRPECSRRPS